MATMSLHKNATRFVLCIDLIEKIKPKIKMKELKLKTAVLRGSVDSEYEGKILINPLDRLSRKLYTCI